MNRKILLVALPFALALGGCWDTGDGEKVGTITRLSEQGVFCKTWEAEIIRGGLNSGSGVMGSAFHFTIEDKSLIAKVQDALNTQREVKIHYDREGVTICRSDSDDNFLTSIEYLAAPSSTPAAGTNTGTPSDLNQGMAALIGVLSRVEGVLESIDKKLGEKQ